MILVGFKNRFLCFCVLFYRLEHFLLFSCKMCNPLMLKLFDRPYFYDVTCIFMKESSPLYFQRHLYDCHVRSHPHVMGGSQSPLSEGEAWNFILILLWSHCYKKSCFTDQIICKSTTLAMISFRI